MPTLQRISQNFGIAISGVLYLGQLFDSYSNADSLINLRRATLFSILTIAFLVLLQLYMRRYGLNWVLSTGVVVRHRSLRKNFVLPFVGALALLWFPCGLQAIFSTGTGSKSVTPTLSADLPTEPGMHTTVTQTSKGAQSPNIQGVKGDVRLQYGEGSRER
jgi:hypothetical protein